MTVKIAERAQVNGSAMSSLKYDDALHHFEAKLQEQKRKMMDQLDRIDVLNSRVLEEKLEGFNQDMVLIRHWFLDRIAAYANSCGTASCDANIKARTPGILVEGASGLLAGGGSAVLMNVITTSSTSWFFWTTSTTLATTAGAAVGVAAGVATLGVGVIGGALTYWAVNTMLAESRRKRVRAAILRSYDDDAVPKLREWASTQLAQGA